MGITPPFSVHDVQNLIHTVHSRRVILDTDLAALYGVPTHRFNEAVKRNARRFPEDFRFRLTRADLSALRPDRSVTDVTDKHSIKSNSSQIAMSSGSNRGLVYLPWAFTEHGALMAANVLRSPRAADVSVHVIRAFINLRDALSVHQELSARLVELERRSSGHDTAISDLCETMRQLLASPEPGHDRKIGFHRP
jgi:hypothetical protein